MDALRLTSFTLERLPQGALVRSVLTAALQAVDPYQAVQSALHRTGDQLKVAEQVYSLKDFRQIHVVGAGKAAYPMALALEDVLGDSLSGGLVITKEGHLPPESALRRVRILEAGHPLPDARGVEATRQMLGLLDNASAEDLVFCLISGGGSALMTAPVDEVSLSDLQQLTTRLLHCGATIKQINTLRKHLDQVKGGGLARRTAPARLCTLILSDVVGDPLDVIASGPTIPDASTFQDAWQVLESFSLLDEIPPGICAYLKRGLQGKAAETLKPGDPLFQSVQNVLVASNIKAAKAAAERTRSLGFHTLLLTTFLQGEARQAGALLAAIARQVCTSAEPLPRPACLIAGGETTVTVRGRGKGGRNQELVLGAVEGLADVPQSLLISLATDGGDGPTDAAGAVASDATLARARALGLDPQDYLKRNDAYHFFEPLDDLLKTGPTQTNVNDLQFLFVF
ncbi:MAG: glycerate kinase [Anaerolineales bacterium]